MVRSGLGFGFVHVRKMSDTVCLIACVRGWPAISTRSAVCRRATRVRSSSVEGSPGWGTSADSALYISVPQLVPLMMYSTVVMLCSAHSCRASLMSGMTAMPSLPIRQWSGHSTNGGRPSASSAVTYSEKPFWRVGTRARYLRLVTSSLLTTV